MSWFCLSVCVSRWLWYSSSVLLSLVYCSVCLSVCNCVSQSVWLYALCIYLSVCLSVCLSVSRWLWYSSSVSLACYSCTCYSYCVLILCLSVCLSVCVCLSICLHVCLCVGLCVCLGGCDIHHLCRWLAIPLHVIPAVSWPSHDPTSGRLHRAAQWTAGGS